LIRSDTFDNWPGQSGSPIFGFWSDGPYAVGVVSGEGDDYNYISGDSLLASIVRRARNDHPYARYASVSVAQSQTLASDEKRECSGLAPALHGKRKRSPHRHGCRSSREAEAERTARPRSQLGTSRTMTRKAPSSAGRTDSTAKPWLAATFLERSFHSRT
jgi:hypothetical protein